jgi:hypothetical protein
VLKRCAQAAIRNIFEIDATIFSRSLVMIWLS